MRRGARASFKPRPFCSSSDARAAVIPVHRNARSDAVLSRSSIPHTLVHSNPTCSRSDAVLSWSLSLFLSFSLLGSSLADCIHYMPFYVYFYLRLFLMVWAQSRAFIGLVRDAPRKLGCPWLVLARWNFPPVTRRSIAHGYTTVSLTPTLSSGSKLLLFSANSLLRANRQSIRLEGGVQYCFQYMKRIRRSKKNFALGKGSTLDVRG